MDVKAAAIRVLRQAGTALHARDISARIIDAGLWQSQGKTPAVTVAARLYSDIKKKGDRSSFVKAGAGTFALRDFAATPGAAGPAPAPVKKLPKPAAVKTDFSFTDCAEKVLEASGEKKPMHYKAITGQALQEGWLNTGGKTPEATMYALVISEIKRRRRRAEQPRFVRHGRGYVGLSKWQARGLAFEIAQHKLQVGEVLRKKLLAMTPDKFEELIEQLLPEMGFEQVELTKSRADGGIDVRGALVVSDVIRIRLAAQVKRWKRNIQAPVVQQVRGSLGAHEQGLIITTSDFSPGAAREAAQADKTPIALMNGRQLVMLLMEHGIGVRRSTLDLFEIDEEF